MANSTADLNWVPWYWRQLFHYIFHFQPASRAKSEGSRGEAGCQLNRDKLWNAAWPYPLQKCRQICLEMSSTITLKFCPKSNAKQTQCCIFVCLESLPKKCHLHFFYIASLYKQILREESVIFKIASKSERYHVVNLGKISHLIFSERHPLNCYRSI